MLAAFNKWFSSRGGVWQVFWISVVATTIEIVFPKLDPNHFWLLFICTVWSFFTQNALAYSARLGSEEVGALLLRIANLETEILADIEEDVSDVHEEVVDG